MPNEAAAAIATVAATASPSSAERVKMAVVSAIDQVAVDTPAPRAFSWFRNTDGGFPMSRHSNSKEEIWHQFV